MTELTLKAIRENPWNVVAHKLPKKPDKLLLEAAFLAADYCCRAEFFLMEEARHGDYTPSWWRPDEICPDAHEESEERYLQALDRFEQIRDLYAVLYRMGIE